jgi:RNA polymerase sigma-70 factor (ECF subfamily)
MSLLESRNPGPFEQLQFAELQQFVRSSVDRLPEFLRLVVILAYYQGLKYKEIAEVLDIPVGTVKSRLHTALSKLQAAWSTEFAIKE